MVMSCVMTGRVRAVAVLVATLTVLSGPTSVTADHAATPRVAGTDRVATAVELSRALGHAPADVDTIVLARADRYADALAGSPRFILGRPAAPHGAGRVVGAHPSGDRTPRGLPRDHPRGTPVPVVLIGFGAEGVDRSAAGTPRRANGWGGLRPAP